MKNKPMNKPAIARRELSCVIEASPFGPIVQFKDEVLVLILHAQMRCHLPTRKESDFVTVTIEPPQSFGTSLLVIGDRRSTTGEITTLLFKRIELERLQKYGGRGISDT
jgi:hypothetical protein